MTYQTEFPDFADMPADVPAGLIDSSWGNEICPSFYIWQNEESPLFQYCRLWIDYANPAEREFPNGKRYMIQLQDEDGRVEPLDLWQSDDWNATKAEVELLRDNMGDILKLSRYFSALIRAEYSADELAEVNAANKANPDQGCATHNYRDANAYMYGAFAALYFRECDAGSESDCALINAAWDIARLSGFAL